MDRWKSRWIFFIFIFMVPLMLWSCSPSGDPRWVGTNGQSRRDSFASGDGSAPSEEGSDQDSTPGDMGNLGDPLAGLKICSTLDFQGVNWPDVLNISERSAIGLGLNITGSFEGTVGWANLANNFDGQGMSLGLLQQNLGQGSLQPLLMSMRQNYPEVLDQEFSLEQRNLLFTMLREWSEQGLSLLVSSRLSGTASLWAQELSALDTVTESPSVSFLSSSDLDSSFNFLLTLLPKNKSSVDWAVNNIYSRDKNFIPEWKESFQGMAETPEYVSEQIGAALYLHERARSYLTELSFTELRSYLFFFDIAVQNGGIPLEDRTEFKTWVKSRPRSTEEEKLLQLLEIRLRRVRAQYRDDVRRRKTTIIKGNGVVHGRKRDLPK